MDELKWLERKVTEAERQLADASNVFKHCEEN